MTSPNQTGAVTQEQVAAWKEKYGAENIRLVEVAEAPTDLEDDAVSEDSEVPMLRAWIRKPTPAVNRAACIPFSQGNLVAAGEIVIKSGWLGGDDRIRQEADYLNPAAMAVVRLLKPRQTALKKP